MRRPLTRWILTGTFAALTVGAAIWFTLEPRLRADRVALKVVRAMQRADSLALKQLSARGTARPSLCLRRHWSRAFWFVGSGRPAVMHIRQAPPGENRYRVVGDVLRDDTVRAVWEFSLSKARDPKLLSVFADSRLGVWTPEVYACLKQGEIDG